MFILKKNNFNHFHQLFKLNLTKVVLKLIIISISHIDKFHLFKNIQNCSISCLKK